MGLTRAGFQEQWGKPTEVGWLFNGTSTQKGQFVPELLGRETGSVGYGWPTRY